MLPGPGEEEWTVMDGPARQLAVDVGGTFIDFVLLDERTGAVAIEKQPSTAAALVDAFLEGLQRLPTGAGDIGRLFHGTTVAINAIVQERGATVGLLTTAGFRDVLGIGRGARPQLYNFHYLPTPPLVPRHLRREVRERMAADGQELVPLDRDELDREVDLLVGRGVEALAICFLHAFANPRHEEEAVARVRERHPDLPVTGSAAVAAEWREFERTSTVTLNAFIQPLFGDYVRQLRARLGQAGFTRPLAVMQSSGGVISAERAAAQPIRTLESGPAGGVIGARFLAHTLGHDDVICADVGGTTYDVGLIQGGEILERTETDLGGRPVVGPAIDIVSIGAGGGSIASIDAAGTLRVGPESAGASPGPACFGLGGTEPTVTDCHLLLGRLDPDTFLGSRMKLDVAAAERAVRRRVAEPTGLPLEQAADGILAIAETNMTYAIRTVTVERGLDPRDFVLFSYGGGGGLFAAAVAAELQIGTVVIPRAPANFSAWGMLNADYREDRALTRVRPLALATLDEVAADAAKLTDEVTAELQRYGFAADGIDVTHRLDIRYVGQNHTITVPVEGLLRGEPDTLLAAVNATFSRVHQQMYGHGTIGGDLEVVTTRVRGLGRVARPTWPRWPVHEPGEPDTRRRVYFRGVGVQDAPVYRRDRLATGQTVRGPAIVEEWTTTVVVPPGWETTVDPFGTLVLTAGGQGS